MFTFIGIFILGIQLGATTCAISCMPIMTPVLLSGTSNKKQAFEILLEYFSAKIVAYTFISIISFFSASIIKSIMNDHESFVKIAGVFIVILGITLLYKTLSTQKGCSSECNVSSKYGYLGIGFFSSFSFCFPLISLVTISGSTDLFINSILYGLFFGFGVVIVPFLLLYFFVYKITSNFLTEFLRHKKIISIFSQLFLIMIGILVVQGLIKL
jgi:cytochrome c biogenesis protein CcdA